MQWFEDGKTEFKREWSESLRKAVIAFANTEGGTIWVGVDDDGSVVGVEDADALSLRICNMVRDSIRPDLSLFVNCERAERDGKTILRVEVLRGTDRPYFAKASGPRPEGVFVRQGASSVPASETRIRDMLRDSCPVGFEEGRSPLQELTFDALHSAFERRGIPLGNPQMATLGIRRPDGLFTNLGYLLSDQCRCTLKLAAFRDADKEVFRDRREPAGSLLVQLEEAMGFFEKWNDVKSDIRRLERVDSWNYDVSDVREVLVNAVVHRDYSRADATLASVFPDRLEVVSIGGIVPGYEPEDIIEGGVSVLRNRNLAGVFSRLGYIEAFGTGIPKIRRNYAGLEAKPVFAFLPHAFKVVLPNRNLAANRTDQPFKSDETTSGAHGETPPLKARTAAGLSRRRAIVELVGRCGPVTRETIRRELDVSEATAIRDIRALLERGSLIKIGAGRRTVYGLA